MQVKTLDHVNLRTTRLQEMIRWYGQVLGFTEGMRPDFGFPGAWLYANGTAFIHLIGIEAPEATGSETALKLEHFAFRATGAAEFEALLERRGERFRKAAVAETDTVVFNVWDPDGNHLHVDFPARE